MKGILIISGFLLLAGCAVGNQYDYRSSSIALPIRSTEQAAVVLAVQDHRPYVLNGDRKADFVGIQRGGFGNPFEVTTVSGESLTDDMAAAIQSALTKSGYRVINVEGDSNKRLLVTMAEKNGAARILVLRVHEWKSDIYVGITLHSDIRLMVMDSSGNVLAESSMQFVEEIGGSDPIPSENSGTLADEFAKRIGYLFNREEIRSAL